MEGKFLVFAKDNFPDNDIVIECADMDDMNNYADECRNQGYISVRTKFKSKAGWIIYSATAEDTKKLGGLGICDACDNFSDKCFLVAILNSYLCNECFDQWDKASMYYPEDEPIERRREAYYDAAFGIEGGT